MKKEGILLILFLSLLLISNIAIYNGTLDTYLLIRVVNSICFALIFVFFKCYRHRFMTIIMVLLILFDLFALNIELASFSKMAMSSRIAIYGLLIFLVRKKLCFNNSSMTENIVYTCIALLNFSLLYMLINMVEAGILDLTHKVIVITSCIVMVLAAVASANYNANKLHRKSMLFMILTYSLAFSDIGAFCGFYLDYPILFYYERIPAMSVGFCLVMYTIASLETKKTPIASKV